MSKFILLCYKDKNHPGFEDDAINKLSEYLSPDNIPHLPPVVNRGSGIMMAYLHGHVMDNVHGTSAYVGNLLTPHEDWYLTGGVHPDGSYALVRSDDVCVELVSDMLASRTIWYVKTSELFIASTSQRAIISLLGDYEADHRVYPWMLANGTMGPDFSWDRRVKMLVPDSRLRLDRYTWDDDLVTNTTPFKAEDAPEEEHRQKLKTALEETFLDMDVDTTRWELPLSGGYDSRAILLMMKQREGLHCFTIAPDQKDKKGTGYIAKSLADHFGLTISFYKRGFISSEPVKTVIERYMLMSEGRVDNIAGYYDGFDLWKDLNLRGSYGVIRGDEIFGWKPVRSFEEVTRLLGVFFFKDYENMPDPESFGMDELEWPDYLKPTEDDTPRNWYNKIYQQFRVPYTLAARSDCKSAYVEVINPLLSRKIVEVARQLPDDLQDDKRLFVEIIASLSPDIPFHSSVSEAHDKHFKNLEKGALISLIDTVDGVDCIRKMIDTADARSVLSDVLVDMLLQKLRVRETQSRRIKLRVKLFLRTILPATLISRTKSAVGSKDAKPSSRMDFNKLAFRAYIIAYMQRQLKLDSELLR